MLRISGLVILVSIWAMPCSAGEAENIQVATAMVEAVNSRNLDQLDELVASDMVRHSTATDGIVVATLEEFKEFLRKDFAGVPDSVITIDIIFGSDEYVALRAIYSGTQTGEVGPFPPSGKRIELPYIGILRFSEGKISEMWVEWDNIFMLKQLGYFPPPGGSSD